jgi:pimeloyl-ACP methyl ester carboxylesterase
LAGQWTLRVPTGVRGSAGTPVWIDRSGELSVAVVGDSLIATMTLAAIADVPAKTMRMASRRVDGKVTFHHTSDALFTNGSDERSVQAMSTYVLEAIGDSLAGVLSQEIPGISGVPDRRLSGKRVASQLGADVVSSEVYLQPQQRIAVETDRRINLYCDGAGDPTVLLDAGAGESMMVWRHVQRRIARVTRACAYDRAGYGFSDAATRASDAVNIVDDVHRLLRAAGIPTPIVYVGHSAAGLYGTLLVATHPQDVAGAVLIDPGFAYAERRMLAAFQSELAAPLLDYYASVLNFLRDCLALAQSGALTAPTTKAATGCVETKGYQDDIDGALRQELTRQYALPRLWAAALSEYRSVWPRNDLSGIDYDQLGSAPVGFGDRPLIVLARDASAESAMPGMDSRQASIMERARLAGLAALAKTSSRGTLSVVGKTGHHVQFDQPDTVVAAVTRVVADVRRALAAGAPGHPLVGMWDVSVVAAHKDEPDGAVTPIMSSGVFSFSMEGDSLIVSMQVKLSPTGMPIRLATAARSDTATFVRTAKALNAVKGERNVLSAVPMVSTYRFIAVRDSLHGSMQVTSGGRTHTWPISGKRRSSSPGPSSNGPSFGTSLDR